MRTIDTIPTLDYTVNHTYQRLLLPSKEDKMK